MLKCLICLGMAAATVYIPAEAHLPFMKPELTPDIVATSDVRIDGIDVLTLRVGEVPSLVIRERRDRLEEVAIDSSEGKLSISASDGGWFSSRDYTAVLTLPTLASLSLSGSFEARISGVNAEALALDFAGSGDVVISGRCTKLMLDTVGAIDVTAKSLICQRVEIDAAGLSDIHVFASDVLDVEGAGKTDVMFSGDPQKVLSDLAGIGSVGAAPKTKTTGGTAL